MQKYLLKYILLYMKVYTFVSKQRIMKQKTNQRGHRIEPKHNNLYRLLLDRANSEPKKIKKILPEIAEATNIKLTKLTRICNNTASNFYVEEATSIAEYLQCSLDELLKQ